MRDPAIEHAIAARIALELDLEDAIATLDGLIEEALGARRCGKRLSRQLVRIRAEARIVRGAAAGLASTVTLPGRIAP